MGITCSKNKEFVFWGNGCGMIKIFSWGQKFYTLSARLACLWKSWPGWQRTGTMDKKQARRIGCTYSNSEFPFRLVKFLLLFLSNPSVCLIEARSKVCMVRRSRITVRLTKPNRMLECG